jgi:hypothetical protein
MILFLNVEWQKANYSTASNRTAVSNGKLMNGKNYEQRTGEW